jgi:GNAT superfamily N-acetyltransferase
MSVLHFRKQLVIPPAAADAAGFRVRQLRIPDDIQGWLTLRGRAMAGETPAVRPWSEADFWREFIEKAWWREDHAWVAVADSATNKSNALAAAVTLGLREGQGSTVPVVHWLLVDPLFRRRGVARALMAQLERASWDAGWREVELETHAGWTAAVALYQSIGYAPVRERSPR